MRQIRLLQVLWLSWLSLSPLIVEGEEAALRVEVTAPYIEMHTGPGDVYPVDQVVARGEWVEVLRRRTDWFQVRTRRDYLGWVHVDEMQQTQTEAGEPLGVGSYGLDDFRKRRWEIGFLGGDMDGTAVLTLYGGYAFNENLSTELSLSQAVGNYSSEYLVDVNLLSQPFPEWRYSPFFTLGSGMINTQPNATLVQTQDRTDTSAHVGIGLRTYLTRRLFLRAEYRHYTVFTSRNDNEDFDQWKIGFGFFF